MSYLAVDIADFKAKVHELFATYPELEDDETLRADMLEAETDLHALINRIIKQKLDADAMASAVKSRKADLAERQARFERKAEGMKTLAKSLMLAADLPKIMLPDATVSITKPRTRVNIIDVNELPQGYFITERKAKSAEIKAALEGGETIPGAELTLGDDGIMVRTK